MVTTVAEKLKKGEFVEVRDTRGHKCSRCGWPIRAGSYFFTRIIYRGKNQINVNIHKICPKY
jgi:hypothetical protein